MEKLYIENFAGLNNVEFEFNSINIIIGPQASGKSVVVKLVYFFKSIYDELIKSIENEENKRELDKKNKDKFINFFPKESWNSGDFKIIYTNNSTQIYIKNINNKFIFDYSDDISLFFKQGKKELASFKSLFMKEKTIFNINSKKDFNKNIEDLLISNFGKLSIYEQLFIPAGRSFFANIQSNIFSFISENRSIDPFLIEFGSFYENMKNLFIQIKSIYNVDAKNSSLTKEFDTIISKLLESKYSRENDKDYLIHNDKRKINLNYASSGQQEILPLIIILKTINHIVNEQGGYSIYLEEPEAHLYPTAQKRIVELLARTFNNENSNFQFFITTHSPYILSAFNNLIYAGNIANKNKSNVKLLKNLSNIISEKEQININLFRVYSLENNRVKNLIDNDSKLITTTGLDSVSDEISLEFEKLLNIEFDDKM